MKRIVEVVAGHWTGLRGEVVRESGGMLRIRISEGHNALVRPSHVRDIQGEELAIVASLDGSSPYDFSESGLGIGGLATYEETPVIPSERQLERLERLLATEQICKRCGASSLDGAMFTTLGGSCICDDCV